MSRLDVDVVVLGGGIAGVAAAKAAAGGGAAVALVEPGPLGGRSAHGTLVPWRALERACRAGRDRDEAWAEARGEADRVGRAWSERSALRLEDHGVERIAGRGAFVAPRELDVEGGPSIAFERAVIATGGQPRQLGEGPRVLDAAGLLSLEAPPAELLVVGGGVGGAELASALSHAPGTTITWMMDELGILPDFDRELAEALGDVLMGRGVKLVHGKRMLEVRSEPDHALASLDGGRTYAAPYAVIAIGTRPRLEGLGLEALGLEALGRGALAVDESCATSAEGIYAAGECTPGCPSAAAAEAMGWIAGRRAAGLDSQAWVPSRAPRVVFSDPELAQIGLTPERSAGREVVIHTSRGEETIWGSLRGVGESPESKGFSRIVAAGDDGEVIGASGAGPGAIAVIGAVELAMALGATADDLGRLTTALPGPLEALTRSVR